jgi:hypothetical protein
MLGVQISAPGPAAHEEFCCLLCDSNEEFPEDLGECDCMNVCTNVYAKRIINEKYCYHLKKKRFATRLT